MKKNTAVAIMLKGVKKIGLTTVDSVSRKGMYEDALDVQVSKQLNSKKSMEK